MQQNPHNKLNQRPESGLFTFQNWPIYREALACADHANLLARSWPKNPSLCGQLRRAAESVVLNIAEGSARNSNKEKIQFFRISKGSVFECAAALDLALAYQLIDPRCHFEFQQRMAALGRMLSGLIRHFEK